MTDRTAAKKAMIALWGLVAGEIPPDRLIVPCERCGGGRLESFISGEEVLESGDLVQVESHDAFVVWCDCPDRCEGPIDSSPEWAIACWNMGERH